MNRTAISRSPLSAMWGCGDAPQKVGSHNDSLLKYGPAYLASTMTRTDCRFVIITSLQERLHHILFGLENLLVICALVPRDVSNGLRF